MSEQKNFDLMPNDIWVKIFGFMGLKELQPIHLVNKQLYTKANELFEGWYRSHFSHLRENTSDISWVSQFFTTFRKEYQKNFSSDRVCVIDKNKWSLAEEDGEIFEVFYIAKTGNLEKLRKFCDLFEVEALDMLQFYRDAADRTPLAWMREKGHQDCLDYVYEQYVENECDLHDKGVLANTPMFGYLAGYQALSDAIPGIGYRLGLAVSCYRDSEIESVREELKKNPNADQLIQGLDVLLFYLAVRYNNITYLSELLKDDIFPIGVDEWNVAVWMFSLVWPRSQLEVFKCLYHHKPLFFNQFFNNNSKYHQESVVPIGTLYSSGRTSRSCSSSMSASKLKVSVSLSTTNFKKWAKMEREGGVVSFFSELSSLKVPLIFLAVHNRNLVLLKILLANEEIDVVSKIEWPYISQYAFDGTFWSYTPLELATALGYKDIQSILELAVFIKKDCQIPEEEWPFQKVSRFLSSVFVDPAPIDVRVQQAALALFGVIIHGKSADILMAHKEMLHQDRLGQLYQDLIPQLPQGDVFSEAFVSIDYQSLSLEDVKPALQPARTSL